MNQSRIYILIIFLVVPICFFVPTVIHTGTYNVEINENKHINTTCSLGNYNPDLKITVDDYNKTQDNVKLNTTYHFSFNESISYFPIAVSSDAEIYNRTINEDKNTLKVKAHETTSSRFNDNKTISFKPSLSINFMPSHLIDSFTYSEYYKCVSSVEYLEDSVGYAGADELIIDTNPERNDPVVYSIESENMSRKIHVQGQLTDRSLSAFVRAVETSGTYNESFNKSSRIQVFSEDSIGPPAYISGRSTENPFILADPQYMNEESDISGHEWAHSFQNYYVSSETEWTIEGFAQYLGGVIENEAGMYETDAIESSFRFGWNERVSKGNETEHSKIRMQDPDTWKGGAPYTRGSRIAYLTDRSIRYHTNGNKNILDLIKRMNDDGYVTNNELVGMVRNMTSPRFAENFERMTNTTNPIDLEEELENMDVENNDVYLPDTFERDDYYIIRCTYDSNVAIVDQCMSEESS